MVPAPLSRQPRAWIDNSLRCAPCKLWGDRKCGAQWTQLPVIVPATTVPFFSSMVTVSLFSFIKNLRAQDVAGHDRRRAGKRRGLHALDELHRSTSLRCGRALCDVLFKGAQSVGRGWCAAPMPLQPPRNSPRSSTLSRSQPGGRVLDLPRTL